MGNADALSRLPLSTENEIEAQNVHAFTDRGPVNNEQVIEQRHKDRILIKVFDQLANGWKNPVSEELKPYFNKRLNEDALIMGIEY